MFRIIHFTEDIHVLVRLRNDLTPGDWWVGLPCGPDRTLRSDYHLNRSFLGEQLGRNWGGYNVVNYIEGIHCMVHEPFSIRRAFEIVQRLTAMLNAKYEKKPSHGPNSEVRSPPEYAQLIGMYRWDTDQFYGSTASSTISTRWR